jgi:8-oxo-dGTP pyrophosphatase MutT (NUDIX family)
MVEQEPIQHLEMKNVAPLTEGDQESRGWKVELNGETIPEVTSLKVVQERMGISLEYGKTPAGYDGLALEEAGGGGAVVIPYVNIDGEIFIGMVEENRPFAGGTVLNVPRGFLNPGETHFQTAKKELEEETGYTAVEKRIKPLEGEPMNPNSTFFVAKDPDKGVRPYKVSINPDEVRLLTDSQNPTEKVYEFNPEVIKPVSRMGERVMRSKFHHWTAALQVRDMFTVAGVGRLVREEVLPTPAKAPQIKNNVV